MDNKLKIENYLFEDIYQLDEEKSQIIGLNFKGTSYTFKEIKRSVDYYCRALGHRMGILGCSTAEMKMSLDC